MRLPPESRPAPESFSTPKARPMSASPALTAMTATRRAVAPVAQALATLYTGMPVWPSCFCSCWPMPALACIRLPAAMTPMSFMVTPPSARAPRTASEARSTRSWSGCLPNLVMWIPRIHRSSDAMVSSLSVVLPAVSFSRCRVCLRPRRARRLGSVLAATGSKPNPTASVPSSSVPMTSVARRTFMPRVTCSGSGSTLIRLARTLVPSQSTTAATKGTGTPGAAKATMVKARTSPAVAMSTVLNSVFPQLAQALRRSKKRAPQSVHSWATRCGSSPSTR